jgi:O-antigen/teichoic acid export membrane protein
VSDRLRVKALLSRPVFRILLGSLIGQGVVLAVSPVLTRTYSPSDFSAFAVITATSAVLGGFVTLSWERAIVVPPEDADARALLLLGFASTGALSGALAAVNYVFRDEIAAALDTGVFRDYWWLTPVTTLFIGLYALISSWIVRHQDYTKLSVRNATQGLSQATWSVTLGLAGVVPLGLISSLAVGRLAGALGIVHGIRRSQASPLKLRDVVQAARAHRRFPLVNTWSRLANALGLHLPIILIISAYGSVETGLYALTVRVMASPIGIIIDATSQYFEGTFARMHREDAAGRLELVNRFAFRMLLLGAIPTVLVLIGAPYLFRTVFGAEWNDAGMFAQLVVFTYLAQFTVAPVSRALVIMGWQFAQLAWDLGRVGLTVGSIFVCSHLDQSFERCLLTLSVVQVIAYAIQYGLCVVAAQRTDIEAADSPSISG